MKTVLVVDDFADYLHLIKEYLAREGFRVFGARSALHALQILHRESIDVLLVDEVMPYGGGGVLLLEAVRNTWPSVTLALVSGAPSADGILRANEIGARVFTKGAPRDILEFVHASPRKTRL